MANTLLLALSLAVAVAMTSSFPAGHVISKRAVLLDDDFVPVSRDGYSEVEVLGVDAGDLPALSSQDSLARAKRGHHHLPIWVNTFQMTDHHANFKWGVRHNVGH